MDDRWAYPIPMAMQRQTGSAPKPRTVMSPSVAPSAVPDKAGRDDIVGAAKSESAAETAHH